MNARVKTVTAAPAHEGVKGVNGDWVVVGVVKTRIWLDENRKGFIRHLIMDRANKELPHPSEAASARNEINEGISSAPDQTT